MTKRKTFEVNELITMVNEMCRVTGCAPDIRQGAINVLEGVLHKTGNYCGFRYLNKFDVPGVPEGQKVGVKFDENGPLADNKARFENTDPTRVYFFYPRVK